MSIDKGKLDLLRQRSVEPFVQLLYDVMQAQPDAETLKAWAARYPGDWANMLRITAGLSGYTDKREVQHSGIIAHIADMGDAQLMDMMRQYALDASPRMIEGKAEVYVDKPAEKVHEARTVRRRKIQLKE